VENRKLRARVTSLEKRQAKLGKQLLELGESEKKYRSIFENTGTISIVFDEKTIITMVNSDFATRMGYSKKEIEGRRSWTDFVLKEDLDRLLQSHRLRSRAPRKAPRHHEFRIVTRKGDILHIFMTIDMIPGTRLRVASLMDITDRIMAEEAMIRISERERQRIGQDLHDDLAPHLIGIEVLASLLLEDLAKNSPADVASLKKIKSLMHDAVMKTKSFARGLCPVHLLEHGFESSIRELAMATRDIYGIPCSVTGGGTAFDRDIGTSTNLYYLIHEAVHNAVRHGRAKSISIDIAPGDGSTSIAVKDDGAGFDADTRAPGMGLKIMRHRARMINASLSIDSAPGHGTTVTVIAPHDAEAPRP
jgi:PAS domain S-box-containing protein